MRTVLNRIALLCLLLNGIAGIAKAQYFNNRYILDKTSMYFGSIILKGDTIIVTGSSTGVDSIIIVKPTVFKFLTDGTAIKSSILLKDSDANYIAALNSSFVSERHNYYVSGFRGFLGEAVFVFCLDSNFNLKWHKEYRRTDNKDLAISGAFLNELTSNRYLLLCYQQEFENNRYGETYTAILIDSLGNELKRLNRGAVKGIDFHSQYFQKVNDNLFLIFESKGDFANKRQYPESFSSKLSFLYLDSNLNVIKEGEDAIDTVYCPKNAVVLKNGNLIIAGIYVDRIVYNERFNESSLYGNAKIICLDSLHSKIWGLNIGKSNQVTELKKLIIMNDGNYLLVGTTLDSLSGSGSLTYSGWLVKISPEGQVLWQRRYYGVESAQEENILNDVEELPNGDIIACGVSIDYTGDFPQRGWLMRLDRFGCLQNDCQLADNIQPIQGTATLFNIFPNPANEVLYIESYLTAAQEQQGYTLSIIDALGRTMATHSQLGNGLCSIATQHWPAGTYWVSIFQHNQRILTQQIQKN